MTVKVKDTDGKTISVSPSSGVAVGSFRGPFVWVSIRLGRRRPDGEIQDGDDATFVHLTRSQAKRLRDALSRFVDEE
jgi:hypothetical protein